MANATRSGSNSGSNTLLTVLIVIAVLYFARTVFIPLSLALLLAFLLAPLVIRLRHWGLGRIPSAVIVVLLFFTIVGIIGSVMASQLTDLAHKLPEYQQNIHRKVQSIRVSGGGLLDRVSRTVRNLTEELTPSPPPSANAARAQERPVPVEIRPSPFSPLQIIQKILGSLLNGLLVAVIVIVFVLFMLIERDDLRDRLLRLGGARRVNVTTNLLDDAAHRVSRYLLAQFVVNVGYGFLTGIALFFLRVPNPLLWGMCAALLRYIPYLGIWIAAAMPAAVAFAVDPGWMKVPLIFGIYGGVDLVMYNVVEPLLYGTSTGISPLAILVAAVFWTWLWGPVGLLLSTPLTVCVVVLGRHVPRLEFLEVLLSDQAVLPPETRFYQRMLAMEFEEASEVAEEFLKSKSLDELFDEIIIPALSLAEENRHRGNLDERRQQFIFEHTRTLVEDLAARSDAKEPGSNEEEAAIRGDSSPELKSPAEGVDVLCVPARDEADDLAALMLKLLLVRRGVAARALSSGALAGEMLEELTRDQPKVACVLAVPPFGYMHARYLCRRSRAQFQGLKLICAILTERDAEELKKRQPPLAADELAISLRQALTQTLSLIQVKPPGDVQPAAAIAS